LLPESKKQPPEVPQIRGTEDSQRAAVPGIHAGRAVRDQTARPATVGLEALFAEHGAPLVLKSDNGSAFKDKDMLKLLAEHDIVWLPSPPRTPWYNGGCEAGNHSMRIRTDHFAERAGGWTSECLAADSRHGNKMARPKRPAIMADSETSEVQRQAVRRALLDLGSVNHHPEVNSSTN